MNSSYELELINNENARCFRESSPESEVEREETRKVASLIVSMYCNDAKLRILIFLSHSEEPSTIRKIARNLRLSHKTVIEHIRVLREKGLVEVLYSQRNLHLYIVSNKYRFLKKLLKEFNY